MIANTSRQKKIMCKSIKISVHDRGQLTLYLGRFSVYWCRFFLVDITFRKIHSIPFYFFWFKRVCMVSIDSCLVLG